jgi:endonuclease G
LLTLEKSAKKLPFWLVPQFFVAGLSPRVPDAPTLKVRSLCYDAFALLHSGVTKTPLFVAERLNKEKLDDAKGEKRTNRFFADARLPSSERAQLEDYKHSGWSRGHMAPAADMPTVQAMAQSFSLANMVPQAPINNQKAWAGIEKSTRKYVMRAQGDVYVITGPVFDADSRIIGAGGVHVPKYLYKLVYDATTSRAWAHWIQNTDEAHADRPISYGELVRRTGIEFLPGARAGD